MYGWFNVMPVYLRSEVSEVFASALTSTVNTQMLPQTTEVGSHITIPRISVDNYIQCVLQSHKNNSEQNLKTKVGDSNEFASISFSSFSGSVVNETTLWNMLSFMPLAYDL